MTQKFYKHHIIQKAVGKREAQRIREAYNQYKNKHGLSRGGGGNSPLVYQGKILRRVVSDFEAFNLSYEYAKSPTANNLPRTGSGERRSTIVKLFGITILEIQR